MTIRDTLRHMTADDPSTRITVTRTGCVAQRPWVVRLGAYTVGTHPTHTDAMRQADEAARFVTLTAARGLTPGPRYLRDVYVMQAEIERMHRRLRSIAAPRDSSPQKLTFDVP